MLACRLSKTPNRLKRLKNTKITQELIKLRDMKVMVIYYTVARIFILHSSGIFAISKVGQRGLTMHHGTVSADGLFVSVSHGALSELLLPGL